MTLDPELLRILVCPNDRGEIEMKRRLALKNRLLSVLSANDRGLLEAGLQDVALETLQVLETPRQRIPYAYFLTDGVASVVGTSGRSIGNSWVTNSASKWWNANRG